MEYFQLLNLKKEPFSSSPDPAFFYRSRSHEECLQRLEIAIRLRRGLNIVFGDVGTGKTTLSRILLQTFEEERQKFIFYLILDPSFGSQTEFLLALIRIFGLKAPEEPSIFNCKNIIQDYLFKKGVEEERIVSLLIDEGQKLSRESIEILRELLNYETNEYKLLQLVVFGQMELMEKIKGMQNFLDRVNMTYVLRPLSLEETRSMIQYRLSKAGMEAGRTLFHERAIKLIHRYSKGYPRKVITLCHHALIGALIKQKDLVDDEVIHSIWPVRDDEGLLIVKRIPLFTRWRNFLVFILFLLTGATAGLIFYLNPVKLNQATSEKAILRMPIASSPIEPFVDPWADRKEGGENEKKGVDESPIKGAHIKKRPQKGERVIMVKRGDTLFRLTKGFYKGHFTPEVYRKVIEANPSITNPNVIWPGQKIVFPELPHFQSIKETEVMEE